MDISLVHNLCVLNYNYLTYFHAYFCWCQLATNIEKAGLSIKSGGETEKNMVGMNE